MNLNGCCPRIQQMTGRRCDRNSWFLTVRWSGLPGRCVGWMRVWVKGGSENKEVCFLRLYLTYSCESAGLALSRNLLPSLNKTTPSTGRRSAKQSPRFWDLFLTFALRSNSWSLGESVILPGHRMSYSVVVSVCNKVDHGHDTMFFFFTTCGKITVSAPTHTFWSLNKR